MVGKASRLAHSDFGETPPSASRRRAAYSLAATLGYVVLEVGDKAPAMFIVAFIPMLLVALDYRDLIGRLRTAAPCLPGAQGSVRSLAGWAAGVSPCPGSSCWRTSLRSRHYLLRFLAWMGGRERLHQGVTGVVFIAIMTYVSYRGIVISERIQASGDVPVAVLILLSVLALFRDSTLGGPQAVSPELSGSPRSGSQPLKSRRSDLVHLPLLGLGFLPRRDRRDQGRRQDSRASGSALYGDLAVHLFAGSNLHTIIRRL